MHMVGEHVFSRTDIDIGEWQYGVTVTNKTTETFTGVAVVFRRTDAVEALAVAETNVGPEATVAFSLGDCSGVQGYVIGAYIGDELVSRAPDVGEQPPGGGVDPFRCADFWDILPP
jgi:hypothetical protein